MQAALSAFMVVRYLRAKTICVDFGIECLHQERVFNLMAVGIATIARFVSPFLLEVRAYKLFLIIRQLHISWLRLCICLWSRSSG